MLFVLVVLVVGNFLLPETLFVRTALQEILRFDIPVNDEFTRYVDADGDFNGDGFCDLAVSAPQAHGSGNPWYPGYVYIFAGNAQLADTTVANEDQVLAPEQALFRMRYYPNPHSGDGSCISYEVEGKLSNYAEQVEFTIHNIKGQLIKQIDVEAGELRKGMGTITTPRLNSGVYIISLWLNGKKSNSEKIIIKKGRNS